METARQRSGRCECGAVTLKLNGDPITGVNCHCLVCQRLSGSGHVFVLLYPADRIEIKGKLSSYEYRADSGKMAKSHFCPGCGSHVFGTNERFPGTCGVMAAYPSLWAMPTSFLSTTAAAASIGLINSFGNLGGFAGPYLIGFFSSRNGSYTGGMWTMTVALVISGVCVLLVRARSRVPST